MANASIHIDESKVRCSPNPGMYGIFYEEINHSGDGGLYAELVRNRNFMEATIPEGTAYYDNKIITPNYHIENYDISDPLPGWKLKIPAGNLSKIEPWTDEPRNNKVPNQLKMTVHPSKMGAVELINNGYWGMGVKKGTYKATVIARSGGGNAEIKLSLRDAGAKLGEAFIRDIGSVYKKVVIELDCIKDCPDAELIIEPLTEGEIYFDYVSVFPKETFKNRENGLRKDLGEALEKLNPGFVRFPGGCIVEGITLENAFNFKRTLGPVEDRPGCWNLWGYRRTDGLGYHEYLQLCEDLNADGMYVCNCGMSCQARRAEFGTDDWIEFFLQDAIDAIEYALAPTGTRWGDERAKNGHPEPFPLKYVEIVNENHGPEYAKRYEIFHQKLKDKFPQLLYIIDDNSIVDKSKYDLYDEHYYCQPNFFPAVFNKYDSYARDRRIYVGEYAANDRAGIGNMAAAASEAVFMIGMERNADVVRIASYAPLFCNVNNRAWPVNLINFDSHRYFGLPSYHAQVMFNNHLAERIVECESKTVSFTNSVNVYANAGLKNGRLVVKAVNFGHEDTEVRVFLNEKYTKAVVDYISSDYPADENTLEAPEKISIKTDLIKIDGNNFSCKLRSFGVYVFVLD